MEREYKWYVLRVRSGMEKIAKQRINDELIKENLLKDVEQIFVPVVNSPTENELIKEIVPIKGSVFMKMHMYDLIERVIESITIVSGFYKWGSKNAVLDEKFITNIQGQVGEEEIKLKDRKEKFEVGEEVAIVNHDIYSTFKSGRVEQMQDDVYYISVLVLGQPTTIKLDRIYIAKLI